MPKKNITLEDVSHSNDPDVFVVGENENWFASLIGFVQHRINIAGNYCPICDKKHDVESLKPIVCSKESCKWRYEELGMGVNIEATIKKYPEVVDIMITLALAAAKGSAFTRARAANPDERRERLFTSFPSDLIVNDKKDFDTLTQILESFPPIDVMKDSGGNLRFLLKRDHNAVDFVEYRVLRWLLASNRAHFVKLKKFERLEEMITPYQFKFIMSAPEKEARFGQLKAEFGSFYVFHGSQVANWHSILRNGLKNSMWASEPGIFTAPNSGTSAGYAVSYNGISPGYWDNSIFDGNITCMAMCEVIDHPTVDKSRGSEIIIHKDEHIVTRYFFVFPGTVPGVQANSIKIPA